MIRTMAAVAAGGAIGAVARYLVFVLATRVLGAGFPWGTLIVNVAGSFVLACLIETMALRWSLGQEMRAFLVIGVLGAFTTFSTFSMDVAVLYHRGALAAAAGYVLASVVLSIAAFFLGLALVRVMLANPV